MNKTQLLALARSLGVAVDDSMTIEQITALMTAHTAQAVVTPVADATPSLTKKQSTIKGFNYTRAFVRLVFANGDTAILGDKDSANIGVARDLKGANVDYRLGDEVKTEVGSYRRVFIDCIY